MARAVQPVSGDSQRRNNFDVLRLAAAVAVLVSHSFALTGRPEPVLGQVTLGTAGVIVFFGISGYLITRSWVHEPHPIKFCVKRALRIYPAFIVVLVITAFVIGPLASALSVSAYFRSSEPVTYVLKNLSLWVETVHLPGIFQHNPYPGVVNGSIWTLTMEARAYVIVAILGILGALRHPRIGVVALIVVQLLAVRHWPWGPYLGDDTFLRAFVVGGCVYLLTPWLPWRWDLTALLLVAWGITADTRLGIYTIAVAFPYAAVVIAHKTPASWRRLVRWGDFSYGIYVWAFVVQQLVALLIKGITPLGMIAISLPVTYALGAASWLLIERNALRLKPSPTAPTTVPAPSADPVAA
jgi:peptidoglycan/LPS O-acetylase OafA/YrhL